MATDFDNNDLENRVTKAENKLNDVEKPRTETDGRIDAFTNDINSVKNDVSDAKKSLDQYKTATDGKLKDLEDKVKKAVDKCSESCGGDSSYDREEELEKKYEDCCVRDKNKLNELLDELKRRISQLEGKCCVPPGVIQAFAHTDVPEGWLWCDGQEVSREKYPELFKVIGTQFGAGDVSTTFNMPDLQGQFLRGFPGNDLDPDRILGSSQGDAIRDIQGHFGRHVYAASGGTIWEIDGRGNNPQYPKVNKWTDGAFEIDTRQGYAGVVKVLNSIPDQDMPSGSKYPKSFTFKASNVVPTAHENRPVNVSLLFCIKASCDC